MRLIDAEHLKRWILARWEKIDLRSAYPLRAIDIIDQIDREDTIEVEPIKHGHWIRGEKIYPDMLNDTTYGYWCSECHHADVHGDNVEVLYCWHCGAKMDLNEVEE